MPKTANRSSAKRFILICIAVLAILFLASINIKNFLSPKKVLGTEISEEAELSQDNAFWEKFLNKNPDYIPGWIEIGRFDKVREIDPNYATP